MKIIANQSILHNNVTNCTFIASELDEEVQTGTREKDSHIEWMGNLNLPAPSQSRISELESENAKLREALGSLKQFLYNEIIERRNYSASKSFEIVLEQIEIAEQSINSNEK